MSSEISVGSRVRVLANNDKWSTAARRELGDRTLGTVVSVVDRNYLGYKRESSHLVQLDKEVRITEHIRVHQFWVSPDDLVVVPG